MVAIVIGIVGLTVLLPVEEDGRLVGGVVTTPPHSMVERIAQVLGHHLRRLHVIRTVVLVSVLCNRNLVKAGVVVEKQYKLFFA